MRYKEDPDSDDVRLYRVQQAHRSSAIYPPSINTASLYTEVPRPGQGNTPENPIPYNNNNALVTGKFYSQFGIVYVCTRDSGIALHNNLADLVNIYVQVYQP